MTDQRLGGGRRGLSPAARSDADRLRPARHGDLCSRPDADRPGMLRIGRSAGAVGIVDRLACAARCDIAAAPGRDDVQSIAARAGPPAREGAASRAARTSSASAAIAAAGRCSVDDRDDRSAEIARRSEDGVVAEIQPRTGIRVFQSVQRIQRRIDLRLQIVQLFFDVLKLRIYRCRGGLRVDAAVVDVGIRTRHDPARDQQQKK